MKQRLAYLAHCDAEKTFVKQAQRRAAAETVARKPKEHFIH